MIRSSAKRQWYARRDGAVRGPFLDEYVERYILLGRIRLNDELSLDRKSWQPVMNFPELFPEELRGLSNWEDYRELVMARIRYDERVSERRRNDRMLPGEKDRRRLADRRVAGNTAGFFRHLLLHVIPSSLHGNSVPAVQRLRVFLLAALLACLVAAYFSSALR
jgi:hypothetical protein